jgi:hypothetical protein
VRVGKNILVVVTDTLAYVGVIFCMAVLSGVWIEKEARISPWAG